MKKIIFRALIMAALVFSISATANAQSKSKTSSNPAVIVVGTAAKVAWVTTKIVVKGVAAPVAKAIFLKAAPKITVYALKSTPKIAAKVLPTALKLALL